MKAVVFLGPSLSVTKAEKILCKDKALYLPPANQADLLSAATTYHPDVIALIDGMFQQSLSVWHKEILYALDQGIQVYGASSMGALRAVETATFGTIGVGKVYEMYASGEIKDDDEVALLHGPAETGYRAISEPMVNLRMTFRKACDDKVVTSMESNRLIDIAKSIYYQERRYDRIFQIAEDSGFDISLIQQLREYVKNHHVDIKAIDAAHLLRVINELPDTPLKPDPFGFVRSMFFETLYDTDRTVRHRDINLRLSTVAHHAALHMPDFNYVNFNSLNKALVMVLADMLNVDVTDEEIDKEIKRFSLRTGVKGEEAILEWIRTHHLEADEFRELFREMAVCRKLQHWLLVRYHAGNETRQFLNELRLRNEYLHWVEEARQEQLDLRSRNGVDYFDESMRELIKAHWKETCCKIDTHYKEWAEEAGFAQEFNLLESLINARDSRRIRRER